MSDSLVFSVSGPEERTLSTSPYSRKEEQDAATVTMTTTYPSQQRGHGGVGERRSREGEPKRRTGGGGGTAPPDLDLDLVEEEAREEDRRRKEEEVKGSRCKTVRQKKRDDQKEQGRRSRSLHRNGAHSWDTLQLEGEMEVEQQGGRSRERRSRKEVLGGQREAFSFLMPMGDDEQHLSDSGSASFSEVSLSAASIATAGWREDSDWRRDESSWRQGNAPGPWLKPTPQKLTQVLTGRRLSGWEIAGGLSL